MMNEQDEIGQSAQRSDRDGRSKGSDDRALPDADGHANTTNTTAVPSDRSEETRNQCCIVAVGTSGDISDLREFLSALPEKSGLGFVVVRHPEPDLPPLHPEDLADVTRFPVRLAADGDPVKPNTVYLAPPNGLLSIADGLLQFSPSDPGTERRMVIDNFLRTLATDQGPNAICVILSGDGTDGALGLKTVKECGGLVIAQDPAAARQPNMPRSAIETGFVDFVMSAPEIPVKLVEYDGHTIDLRRNEKEDSVRDAILDNLRTIAMILRTHTGHDFSNYKRSTLLRRVQRRMKIVGADSVAAYLDLLRESPEEIASLFHDFLISVTHFFRDPEAFVTLAAEVIPSLFATERNAERGIRIWVPGCATGEEAYSIAILLGEHMARHDIRCPVQIFSTDIDTDALEFARRGLYPEGISEHVSPERLARYFTRRGNRYQVNKEIRDLIVFSAHNLLKDPPFSHLDLIACRNLLIYFESEEQNRVLSIFHYALDDGGFLFLGPSENIAGHSSLFKAISKPHRIYRKKELAIRSAGRSPFIPHINPPPQRGNSNLFKTQSVERDGVRGKIERIVLDQFSPAWVLVDEANEILYSSGNTDAYLTLPTGVMTTNVIDMARKGLRLDLRAMIALARRKREVVVKEQIVFRGENQLRYVDLIVRPANELEDDSNALMIIFKDLGPIERWGGTTAVESTDEQHPAVLHLESELRSTREQLQTTIEELETSNEELKSSNEELISMNEELQSGNEELQTSKEELQSVNEELFTVNSELYQKIDEVNRINSDLHNLFQNTRIAVIFVGGDLRVKRFTPAATELFRIIDSDVGRSIEDVKERFVDSDLASRIEHVVRTLETYERKVVVPNDDRAYLMRIHPYRTVDNVIDGVVMTFNDVTMLERAEYGERIIEAMMRSIPEGIVVVDADGLKLRALSGKAMEMLTGNSSMVEPEVAAELFDHRLLRRPDGRYYDPEFFPLTRAIQRGEIIENEEVILESRDGQIRLPILVNAAPLRDGQGTIVGGVAAWRDISDMHHALDLLRLSEERHRALVATSSSIVWTTGPFGRVVEPQKSWERYTGQPWPEHEGNGWLAMIHQEDRGNVRTLWGRSIAESAPYRAEGRVWHAPSESYRYFIARAVPILDDHGTIREWVGTFSDVHDQKKAELALRESELRFRIVADAAPVFIWMSDVTGAFTWFNRPWVEFVGRPLEEIVDSGWLEDVHPDDRKRYIDTYLQSFERRERFQMEYRLRRRDGVYRWVLDEGTPRTTPDGEFSGYVGACIDISDRKEAELIVLESRSRLDAALSAADMGTWRVDLTTMTTARGRDLNRIFGLEPVESTSTMEDFLDRVHPDDRQRVADAFEKAASGGKIFEAEYRLIRTDGSVIWLRDRGLTFGDKSGTQRWMTGAVADITSIKEIEQALRESEGRYHALADELDVIYNTMPVGISILDTQFRYVRVNRALAESHGIPAEEHVGRSAFELFPGLESMVRPLLEKVFATGEPIEQMEINSTEKPGVYPGTRNWLVSYYPIFNQEGEVEQIISVVHDITLLKEAEQAIKQSEQHLRAVLNSLLTIVAVLTPEGEVAWANRASLDTTGYDLNDVRGTMIDQVAVFSASETIREQVRDAVAHVRNGETVRLDVKAFSASGHAIVYDLVFAPMYDSHGAMVNIIISGLDITDRVQAERALRDAQRQLAGYAQELEQVVDERTKDLRESMESLEGFTYSVAHDLRGPLRAMHGMATLLAEDYGKDLGADARTCIERIRGAALRMDRLINDLLEFGHISQLDLPLEQIDLEAQVRRAIEGIREEAEAGGATIDVGSPMPPVTANAIALRQIITNLVTNALKFVEEGTIPHVRIRTEEAGDTVRLIVADNGIGILKEYHEKIFGIFEKLDDDRRYAGTGIGLALVRKAAERIDATIGLNSEPGRGSEFIVTMRKG